MSGSHQDGANDLVCFCYTKGPNPDNGQPIEPRLRISAKPQAVVSIVKVGMLAHPFRGVKPGNWVKFR